MRSANAGIDSVRWAVAEAFLQVGELVGVEQVEELRRGGQLLRRRFASASFSAFSFSTASRSSAVRRGQPLLSFGARSRAGTSHQVRLRDLQCPFERWIHRITSSMWSIRGEESFGGDGGVPRLPEGPTSSAG